MKCLFLAWFFRRFQYRVAQGLVGQVEEEMETDPAETRTALAKLKTLGKKHQAPVSRVGNIHQGIVAWKQDSYICCIRYSQTHYMHVVKSCEIAVHKIIFAIIQYWDILI